MSLLGRMREHPAAPRWTWSATDRLEPDDLPALDGLRVALEQPREPQGAAPSGEILARVARWGVTVPLLRGRLPADLERHWEQVPTTSREDLATHAELLVPDDADLTRLIVYRTAGVTGHALLVPHHPGAVASYLPLMERALARHGVAWSPGEDQVGAVNLGAQARTVTYCCTLSAAHGTGFAKLNLRPGEWPYDEAAASWLGDMAPRLLTGDPLSFGEALRGGIALQPGALVSTAVAMSSGLRRRLAAHFGAPVIDWYSLTETGPIGYRCPLSEDYHILPCDLHVELLDAAGRPVAPRERGQVVVTGGRNPYVPLVRYLTGDWATLDTSPCLCGDPSPRLRDLEGRAPVRFRARDGSPVNPVDVSRRLREHPLVQHELTQRSDGSLDLAFRAIAPATVREEALREELRLIFGECVTRITEEPTLGLRQGKVLPYRSELLEE